MFRGRHASAPPPPPSAMQNFLLKAQVCEVVVQKFHFTSNTPMILSLHDQFCAGQNYTVMDNGVYLAENFPSLPTICGVSTAFQNLQLIYSPEFMKAEYPLPAGEHKLLIVVKGSRIGGHVSSMQIILYPTGPVNSTITFEQPPKPPAFPTCPSPACDPSWQDSSEHPPICRINKMSKETRYLSPEVDISTIRD